MQTFEIVPGILQLLDQRPVLCCQFVTFTLAICPPVLVLRRHAVFILYLGLSSPGLLPHHTTTTTTTYTTTIIFLYGPSITLVYLIFLWRIHGPATDYNIAKEHELRIHCLFFLCRVTTDPSRLGQRFFFFVLFFFFFFHLKSSSFLNPGSYFSPFSVRLFFFL